MDWLRSCPFCGCKAAKITTAKELEECSNFDGCLVSDCGMWTIVCDFHKGGCGASTGYFFEKQKAIEAWNRRANECDREALIKIADMLECDGECGKCECGKGIFCEAPTIAADGIRKALGIIM